MRAPLEPDDELTDTSAMTHDWSVARHKRAQRCASVIRASTRENPRRHEDARRSLATKTRRREGAKLVRTNAGFVSSCLRGEMCFVPRRRYEDARRSLATKTRRREGAKAQSWCVRTLASCLRAFVA